MRGKDGNVGRKGKGMLEVKRGNGMKSTKEDIVSEGRVTE